MSYASASLRDISLADPEVVGRAIQQRKAGMSASEAADEIRWNAQPHVPVNDSTAMMTARAYREELEARAAQGDKYAASMLAGEAFNEGEVADHAPKAEPAPAVEPVDPDKPWFLGFIDGEPVYGTQAEYEELKRVHNGNGVGV